MTGVPVTRLDVQFGGYNPLGPYYSVTSIVDSGGNHGSIPGSSSVLVKPQEFCPLEP